MLLIYCTRLACTLNWLFHLFFSLHPKFVWSFNLSKFIHFSKFRWSWFDPGNRFTVKVHRFQYPPKLSHAQFWFTCCGLGSNPLPQGHKKLAGPVESSQCHRPYRVSMTRAFYTTFKIYLCWRNLRFLWRASYDTTSQVRHFLDWRDHERFELDVK